MAQKDYLSKNGLTYFLNKILAKVNELLDNKVDTTDAITNDEIDTICGTTVD